jgi:hypothetical protein
MTPAGDRLRKALETFRRELALEYQRQLAGEPRESSRALSYLVSDEALELLGNAQQAGELSPSEYAAVCAHFARARLEQGYVSVRKLQAGFGARPVAVANDKLPAAQVLREWSLSPVPARREAIERGLDGELADLAQQSLDGRSRGDGRVHALASRIALPRHADAGPEGGSAAQAARFLADSQDLMREALDLSLRQERLDADDGATALWAVLAHRFTGMFTAEGRPRRTALDWEPLGLRALLTSHARASYTHDGPGVMPHVLARAMPRDVRVCPSALDGGLAGELAYADGVGRAVGYVHASPALPFALRHASVATLARSMGALGVLRFVEPLFLRRVRGLVKRESETVARAAATFMLLDARLAAAAVLARPLSGPQALEQAAELASKALTLPLPQGVAAWLVVRLSPGGPFRAKSQALGIAEMLRTRFDEDWFLNPRSAEPLRGALSRAGEFSVEAFAAELSATPEAGLRKLSELF